MPSYTGLPDRCCVSAGSPVGKQYDFEEEKETMKAGSPGER